MIRYEEEFDPFFPVLDQDTFFEFNGRMYPCYNYHTIAREDKPRIVFSVPKRSWVLITYKESVDEAKVLAERLFEKPSLLDLEHEYNGTDGSVCFMRFWERDFFEDPIGTDVWYPVVCISNSYDRSGALHYDFGFQVKGFDSNIIFEDFNINLKVNHNTKSKEHISDNLETKLNEIKFENKSKFIKKFIKKIKKLIDKGLGKSEVFPLVLKFLEADVKEKSRQTTKDAYIAIKKEIDMIFLGCDKLDIYTFMKEMSGFIETTTTLTKLKEEDKDDDEEDIEEENRSGKPQLLSYKMRIRMQKKLGVFIDKIIKESIEHKDEDGDIDPILIKDWIGKKYFDMVDYILSKPKVNH